jgi:GNAT superfamily N-acetyltransferase
VVLPPGFRIVDMIENHDFRGKKVLTANAFQNGAAERDVDVKAYEYARQSPIYEARYDLSVVDDEGRHVAACEGFAVYSDRMAEVERVCTHSDYRRRGLAEAVIRACFHRLFANGIDVAYITGYSGEAKGLYARLGAVEAKQWLLYACHTDQAAGKMVAANILPDVQEQLRP